MTHRTIRTIRTAWRAAALLAVAGVVAAAAHAVAAHDDQWDDDRDDGSYSIALFGDMPYNALGKAQYPAMLADVNRANVAFSVHDGDLKAGGDGPCSDSLYYNALNYFNSLESPLVLAVGDNDWTDCWGRYGTPTLPFSDPEERLEFERTLFFSTDWSLGQRRMRVTRQPGYPENQRWKAGPVVYLAMNVQGSNDNYAYSDTETGTGVPVRSAVEIQRQRNEEMARKAANMRWLDEGFAYAKRVHAKGVMIVWQADPNFNNEQHLTNAHDWDAYADYVNKLRAVAEAFKGQVVLVHGDTHYYKVDKPINHTTGGGVLGNFTRLETFGARNTHWVKVRIEPRNPNLFVFEPQIVPANAQ
jgi:hypothetical protein